ncbi:MAG: ORF6N domain-containing protein [Acidobacteria bacterium]|nr:ORF6N domain-containing protein [Acidobacteriota bacterium]
MDQVDDVKQHIIVARGQRVMLDHDLARLYGVTTKQLNQQLKRNRKRFPADFAFRLTLGEAKEIAALRSQNVTLKRGRHIKHAPHVFTEHGAIMLGSVLKSKVAMEASIYVVRAFVKMRTALMEYAELARRIDELEARYDHRFQQVFEAIRSLIALPSKPKRPIGFIQTRRSAQGRKLRP